MAKVLIVEDDALLTRMYTTVLTRGKHQVIAAPDGHEGLTKAKTEQPDVILLDIMMPKFNGLQALDELRRDQKTAQIPIAVLTNLSNVNSAQDVLNRGADKFIDKSQFEPKNLAPLVEEMVKLKQSRASSAAAKQAAAPASQPASPAASAVQPQQQQAPQAAPANEAGQAKKS